MLNNRRRAWLGIIVIPLTMLATAVAPTAPANAASSIETMPLWRLQVRVTTGDTASAGTKGKPAFRFNATSTGVRTLNPPGTPFSAGRVGTFDLRLFDNPSQLTMLRVGIAGNDDWCIKKVELLLNERVAFAQDAVPGGSACATIKAGTYLEFSSAQLRSNASWFGYGTPPELPGGVSAGALWSMISSVTGSAMLSSPGYTWDPTRPLTIVRRNTDSVGISYGVVINDPSGIESSFRASITYDARLFVGADRLLHVRKANPSCCYHETMSDSAIAHLDQSLMRMTRVDVRHRLLFSIDSNASITWRYAV